jgi:hypothetical protein
MITRLYVDNFRCLVNFEYKPAPLQLIFGDNGTGKSTALQVLGLLREFLTLGNTTEQTFLMGRTLTAWQTRPEQVFELDIDGNGGIYTYRLILAHDFVQGASKIKEEELRFDGQKVYFFGGEDVQLFRDDFSPGPVYPHETRRSGIAFIPERRDNQKLTWFRQRMNRVYFLAIDPLRMDDASFGEDPIPHFSLNNLASWYRHLAQDAPEKAAPLFESLSEVMVGFTGLKLTSEGERARLLRIGFKNPVDGQGDFLLRLSDLSPGQRCLIALFTVLHCAVLPDVTICIDEPDNFVALREIQPWVIQLQEQVEQQGSQCLLISHHPELIDLLAVQHGVRFTRTENGPVRVGPFDRSRTDGLSPSEVVARGWED